MKVKVQFYDDKPLSASVPKRVTCTVKDRIAVAATPRYMSSSEKIYIFAFLNIRYFASLLLAVVNFFFQFCVCIWIIFGQNMLSIVIETASY